MGWVINDTHRPLYPWKRPGPHCKGGWVGPRVGMDEYGKYRPHRYSIRRELLHRLSYPGPLLWRSEPKLSQQKGSRNFIPGNTEHVTNKYRNTTVTRTQTDTGKLVTALQKATDFKSWGYTAGKRERGHEGGHEGLLNWGTCRTSRLIRPAMH
jgi:hypothetical protein